MATVRGNSCEIILGDIFSIGLAHEEDLAGLSSNLECIGSLTDKFVVNVVITMYVSDVSVNGTHIKNGLASDTEFTDVDSEERSKVFNDIVLWNFCVVYLVDARQNVN